MKLIPLPLLVAAFVCFGCASAPSSPQTTIAPKVEPAPSPLPVLAGDEQIKPPFQKSFREWLRDDHAGIYQRVTEISEVGNGVTLLLERQVTVGGECRVGPSALSLTLADNGTIAKDISHFGDDCCPGTTCTPSRESHNLRWIAAVAAKDWAKLEQLVPAKGKLTYELVASSDGRTKKSKKTFTRRDVAAGKFEMAPGCGFIHTTPSCGEAEPKTGSFTCRCDGGGTHTSFEWKREGDDMVVVRIEESSE